MGFAESANAGSEPWRRLSTSFCDGIRTALLLVRPAKPSIRGDSSTYLSCRCLLTSVFHDLSGYPGLHRRGWLCVMSRSRSCGQMTPV